MAGSMCPGARSTAWSGAGNGTPPRAPPRGWSAKPFGNTANPASPHYADLTKSYAAGELRRVWLTRPDILAHAESALGEGVELPPLRPRGGQRATAQAFFMPMPPSRQQHALCLAKVIMHTMVAAGKSLLTISEYRRENAVVLSLGTDTLKPDGSMQL